MPGLGDLVTVGVPRAGRLLETPSGLLDLATGCRAFLSSQVVGAAHAATWQPPPHGLLTGSGAVVVDAWLTEDWLGRWMARVVSIEGGALRLGGGGPWPRGPAIDVPTGVTRTADAGQWCRLAARARAAGVVPVHLACLPYLRGAQAREWPPLVVAASPSHGEAACPAVLEGWVARGGRVAALVHASGMSATHLSSALLATPAARSRGPAVSASASLRQLRRAWRALPSAPPCPSFARIAVDPGGRDRMTHLELLDVSAQLDEVRRDEDALVVACRSVRHHTQADHAAILAAHGGEPRLLAADGPVGDSLLAWRQLCREDAPPALVSARGWHAAGRHDLDDRRSLYVCACWPSPDAGQARQSLLPVFARLVAGRVPIATPPAATAAPGLEQSLVGDSTVMRDVRAQIALAARAPFPVLVRGESGCGKELAARAIHALGQRRHRRCAAINCAALPDDLIESELFGHVRGAFTGAATDRAGLFDEADGGTLFLDEVGELGGRAQAKLLRVLQDGEVRRVGENQPRRVDVRVIAATNVALEDAVRRGTFRADLFYRLDVVRVRMPALRERRDDIPMLARHFWEDCTTRVGSRARLDARVLEELSRYDWPGNVRQLQNTLAALAVRVPTRGRVSVEDLPPELHTGDAGGGRSGLDAARREFEATFVRNALSRAGGRPSLAARDLGLTRQGLTKLVRRLGLDEAPVGSRLP